MSAFKQCFNMGLKYSISYKYQILICNYVNGRLQTNKIYVQHQTTSVLFHIENLQH